MNHNIQLKDCLMDFMKERNFVDESVVEGRLFFVKEADLRKKTEMKKDKSVRFLGYSFSVQPFGIEGLPHFENYKLLMNGKECVDIQMNIQTNEAYIIKEYSEAVFLDMFLENIEVLGQVALTPADILSMVLMKNEITTEHLKGGNHVWIWGIGELDEFNRSLSSEELSIELSELEPVHYSLLKFLADFEVYEKIQSGNRSEYIASVDPDDVDLAVIIAHCPHLVVGDRKGYNSLFYTI